MTYGAGRQIQIPTNAGSVEVIFDTICPWCYIGFRRLSRALKQTREHPRLLWRPFLLNPDMAPEGMDRGLYLERKFGSGLRIGRMLDSLTEAGRVEGITFRFDAITRTPSTINSHKLISAAPRGEGQSALIEAIFSAYFEHGLDVGDPLVLAELGESIGVLSRDAAITAMTGEQLDSGIHAENVRTHRIGINGVPCFIFDGRFGIAGAQDVEILARLIDLARQSRRPDDDLNQTTVDISWHGQAPFS